MLKFRTAFGFAVLSGLLGCGLPTERGKTQGYFNLDSALTVQVTSLASSGASIEKKAQIDGKEEVRTYVPDSAGWVEEFDFIREFDPSQPRYQNAFRIEQQNEQTRYVRIEEGTGLRSFLITRGVNNEILQIAGTIEEKASIYSLMRVFRLEFDQQRVTEILFSGNQKMVSQDSITFEIGSRIKYETQ